MCLCCDPFEGDYGGSGQGDRILRDQMTNCKVSTRRCFACCATIKRGERARIRVEIYDGEFMRWSWCELCCRAMADAEHPEAWEERLAIGNRHQDGSRFSQPEEAA